MMTVSQLLPDSQENISVLPRSRRELIFHGAHLSSPPYPPADVSLCTL